MGNVGSGFSVVKEPLMKYSTTFTDESRPRERFNPAETLVQKGTTGDVGTGGGTLKQPVLVQMYWVSW